VGGAVQEGVGLADCSGSGKQRGEGCDVSVARHVDGRVDA
jgi:hypothetical protein